MSGSNYLNIPFNDQRDWFSSNKFGMFIHFGIYAITKWHEQVLMRSSMTRSEYELLKNEFNPMLFDADEWVKIAKETGMEFICITTKHHDGFCLWDTAYTDYNIMNTPYKKDLLKQLSIACEKQGVGFGVYYSLPDWHHENYPNLGRHHELDAPRETDDVNEEKYLLYVKNQVRELCVNYGVVNQFFWDINVANFKDASINEMIRQLQPSAIINDRGPSEGDFVTPERELPKNEIFAKRVMAVNSIGKESWGYREQEDYYSNKYLMQSIDRFLAMGGSYMLNVGPMANGEFNEKGLAILQRIGIWYQNVKEAFKDTKSVSNQGIISSCEDILITTSGKTIYLHAYNGLTSSSITFLSITKKPVLSILLNTGENLKTVVDLIPSRYKERASLRIVGIPVNKIADEPIVIKLVFDESII